MNFLFNKDLISIKLKKINIIIKIINTLLFIYFFKMNILYNIMINSKTFIQIFI